MRINKEIRKRFFWRFFENEIILLDHFQKSAKRFKSTDEAVQFIGTKIYGLNSSINRVNRILNRKRKLEYINLNKQFSKK